MVYWFTRIATWLLARTPRAVRVPVASALTVAVYYAWASKRRVTIANMAQTLGTTPSDPRARRLARESWHNYGRYVADFLYASGRGSEAAAEELARLRDTTPPPGCFALIDEARTRGKGVIIASAHFGNWDVAGMLLARRCPLHVVVERFADERMDQLVQSQRKALGMEVLWMEKSPRQMVRVLQQNGVLAIVADRPLPEGEGVPVTFFGRRCYVPGGVAQLAQLTGAAIIPGFAYYDDEGSLAFYARVEPMILPQTGGDRKAETQRLTQCIYDAFERVLRDHPDQWYMFRPFWPASSSALAIDTGIAAGAVVKLDAAASRTPPDESALPSTVISRPDAQGELDG
ncbi:MAG TPA: lysophospholipid acyltransferase family protein [Ktedonobacterales bacterium]